MADSDPFDTAATEPGWTASLGETPLDAAIVGGSLNDRINELPSATLQLSQTLMAGQPVDYFATLSLSLGRDGGPAFSGNVTRADSDETTIELDGLTHPSLNERKVGVFEALRGDAREIMHVMTRAGGLSEDQVKIEGLDELPLEMIEVLIPLYGISVASLVRLGPLVLLDPSESMAVVDEFSAQEECAPFRDAHCHALYRAIERRMFDVELAALAAVDATLSWLATRARYGLTHLPDGRAQTFVRTRALARPRRADILISRGIESRRTWLRSLARSDTDDLIEVGIPGWSPPAPNALTHAQRLGLSALRSAVDAEDPLVRVQALFQAVEYYVAGVEVPKRFDKAQARRVRRALPKDIDPELRQRALDLLAKMNDPPLMAKLRETARRDGVPITEAEFDLLGEIRTARNGTVHGRAAEPPTEDELNYAVSLVARLMLYALGRAR